MIEINSTTPPDVLVQEAQRLALASDLVGLTDLMKRAQKAGVDRRILEMMSAYFEVVLR